MKKKGYVYLTYEQVMILLHGLEQTKKENPNYEDEIVFRFEEIVLERAKQIALAEMNSKFKSVLVGDKYPITEAMLRYISNLTGVNPLDKTFVDNSMSILQEEKEDAMKIILSRAKN